MTTPEKHDSVMSWSGVFMSLRDHLIKSDLIINEHARGFAEFSGNTKFAQYVGKKVKFHQIYLMKSGGIKVTVSPTGRSSVKFVVPLGCLSYSCSPSTPIFSSFQPSCLVVSASSSES